MFCPPDGFGRRCHDVHNTGKKVNQEPCKDHRKDTKNEQRLPDGAAHLLCFSLPYSSSNGNGRPHGKPHKNNSHHMHDLAADGNGRNARRSFKLADDNKVCHPVKGLQEIGNDKGNGKRNKALPNTPRKGIDSHKTRS